MANEIKLKKWNGSAWVQQYPEVRHTDIVTSGTPSSSTFLRGDGQWATVEDSGNQFVNISGDTMTGNLSLTNTNELQLFLNGQSYGSSLYVDSSDNTLLNARGGSGKTLTLRTYSGSGWNTGLVMDDAGNVGIGTTTPSELLEVEGSGTTRLAVTSTGGATLKFKAASGNAYISTSTNDNIIFQINDTSQHIFNTAGNVGIGTTSPTQKLDVSGNIRASSNMYAARYYDLNNTGYYVDPASTSVLNALTVGGNAVATENYVDTEIANLVASAPSTLDTLNELAAALGDDENFSTTMTNSLAGKLNLTGGTLTGTLTSKAINMQNFNLSGVGAINFNDPGVNEGINWSNIKLYESPDNLTNAAGNFQVATGSTRLFTVRTNGDVDIPGGSLSVSDNVTIGGYTAIHRDNRDDTYAYHDAGDLAVGWYTIATNSGNRAIAKFGLRDTDSSRHQSVIFIAAHHYGNDASNTITVLHNSRFGTSPFRYIRIKEGGTYDGAALQIYIDDAQNNVRALMLGDNFQSSGWVLKDWVGDAIDPQDVSNYSSFTEAGKIDLDQIDQGGIATTGNIYAGGDTTQYRVLTTNDEGSGNGIDADTLDGVQGSSFLRSDTADTASGDITFTGNIVADLRIKLNTPDNNIAPLNIKSDAEAQAIHIEETGTGNSESWQIGVNGDGDLNFYNSGSATPTIQFYDSNSVFFPENVTMKNLQMTSNQNRTKIRVWSGSTYGMGMHSGFTYGGLGDYAMTFQMNDDLDRGFWWGHSVHTTAQGAMALTTDGELTVANAIRVGYGEADTTTPADNVLDINGNVTIAKVSSGGQNQIKFQEVGTTKTQLTSNYGDDKFYLYHEGDNVMVIDSSSVTTFSSTVNASYGRLSSVEYNGSDVDKVNFALSGSTLTITTS